MYDVVFNSGFIGFLIWALLFATSTVALAVTIRCFWILRNVDFRGEVPFILPLPFLILTREKNMNINKLAMAVGLFLHCIAP